MVTVVLRVFVCLQRLVWNVSDIRVFVCLRRLVWTVSRIFWLVCGWFVLRLCCGCVANTTRFAMFAVVLRFFGSFAVVLRLCCEHNTLFNVL